MAKRVGALLRAIAAARDRWVIVEVIVWSCLAVLVIMGLVEGGR